MANNWIKVREKLLSDPKVGVISKILARSKRASSVLLICDGLLKDNVTRNVMRHVTVSLLVTTWTIVNEHAKDGILEDTDLDDLDDLVGCPDFGSAILSSGWCEYNAESNCLIFPNFNEYNTSAEDRTKESNRERQRRYREKQREQASQSNAKSNVTDNVTNNDREEKRREEKSNNKHKKNIKKSRLSEDAVLSKEDRELALSYWRDRKLQIDPDDQFMKFKNYHLSNGTTRVDWSRAWVTWYSSDITLRSGTHETNRQPNQQGRASQLSNAQRQLDSIAEARKQVQQELC